MKNTLSPVGTLVVAVLVIVMMRLTAAGAAQAPRQLLIDDFSGSAVAEKWQEKSFVGHTTYTLEQDGTRRCLRATSRASASGLFHEIRFSTSQYPYLAWEWKVENVVERGDERSKEGDDYAARIYVVFPGTLFWNTRVLNYIWANRLPKGQALPNAFTKNAMMIAVESGRELTGRWLTEKRNIHEDFLRYFGEAPPEAGAIAIMTDTDNTGASARACYGSIRLYAQPPPSPVP